MESLSYAFEGRALLFTDDTDFPVDGFVRNRNLSKKWDGDDPVESMGFIEPLLPDTTRKSFLSNQCLEISGDDTNDHSGKSVQSASTITLNSLVDRFSGCVDRDNDEKFAAQRECNENMFSVDNSVFSSPEPSVSAKRAKVTNLQSQIPTCQVHGCNKDLSSSKDYHKRHKVCDVHSKTAVVIVNGIQQRFCQQCSRFHVLAEFDEGKRSCRKRLAGHNERRRKPQFETHLGSSYFTTDASKTSLIFSRILPGGFFNLQRNEPNNHNRHLTLEEEPNQISQLDERFDQSHPKSVLHFHGVGKQYPSKNCLNAPLSLPVFSVGSDSGCALSLLSAQSQSLLNNSAGISTAHSLTSKENRHANLFTFQNSATPLGEIPENLTPFVSDSSAVEQERLHLVPNSRVAADSEIRQNQEPNTLKLKRYLSPEGANTVDLLELSLHLQRVEQQKYYGHVKLENGIFCDSTIT